MVLSNHRTIVTRTKGNQTRTSKAGNVLLAINPFRDVKIFGNDFVTGYKEKILTKPHVYAMFGAAYHDMMKDGGNQSILIRPGKNSLVNSSDRSLQQELENQLGQAVIGPGEDSWECEFGSTNGFSVMGLKTSLQTFGLNPINDGFEWCKWVPKKVNLVGWRTWLDRLPTVDNLQRRNIPCPDPTCVLCGDVVETPGHLFTGCQFSQTIWEINDDLYNLPFFYIFGVKDFLNYHLSFNGSKKIKMVVYSVVLIALWSIWKSRNNAIFENVQPRVTCCGRN